ncbi:MAG: NACHT domain-containing protein [Oscillatoriophycideae cyanobacterium NC_groundwater_1537_Pr4_S-0.65um_50_18]|nr:NACHT domain-containing protein [Oscillatoriophycideae cyanobacterium NC_groundwater_1537_Pr4_S-0.65um_50_18]
MTQPSLDPQTPLIEQIKKLVQDTLLSWGLPGAGLGLTVHFGIQGNWSGAIAALIGTAILTFLLKFFTKLDPRLDALAEWSVSQFEQSILRLWWSATGQFQGKYYQTLIYRLRDFRVQGLKTKGPFSLDLQKVFVPLKVAPESADRIPSALIQTLAQPREEGKLSIWNILAVLPQQPSFRRMVILGPPGSGKSTLLEHLTLSYAQNSRIPRLIPVLLYLRDVQEAIAADPSPTLAALIEQQESLKDLKRSPDWFEVRLKQGKCLVLLDGLDEVADLHRRQQVSRWCDHQMQRYPTTAFILTSRPFGYRSAPLMQVGMVLEIQPFDLKQMQQFIQNWYLQNEIMRRLGKEDAGVRHQAERQSRDLIQRIQDSPAIAAMALNPLLLTMIATIHCYRGALPGRRVELYAEICDVLLGRRQEAKGLPDPLTATQKRSVLQVLALNRMRKASGDFTLLQGSLLIQKKLVAVAGDSVSPEAFLKQVENVSGLLLEKESGKYAFAHKSFQEYLASAQVKESHQEILLARHIDDPWWEETIRLYAAQSDASYLISTALQKGTVAALSLAYDCLEEGLSVEDGRVRKELEDALEKGLAAIDPAIFKLAAEVKLQRRLGKLLRIDDRTEIDQGYISCAEYQLFVDEKRLSGEHYQPPHWIGDRFTPGTANQAIVGVRASDAEAFCDWLTQHSSDLGETYLEGETAVFTGDFRFRLPTLSEVQNHPVALPIGCWCWDGDRIVGGAGVGDRGRDAHRTLAWEGIRIVRCLR